MPRSEGVVCISEGWWTFPTFLVHSSIAEFGRLPLTLLGERDYLLDARRVREARDRQVLTKSRDQTICNAPTATSCCPQPPPSSSVGTSLQSFSLHHTSIDCQMPQITVFVFQWYLISIERYFPRFFNPSALPTASLASTARDHFNPLRSTLSYSVLTERYTSWSPLLLQTLLRCMLICFYYWDTTINGS